MQSLVRKVYLSIMVTMLCLITLVTVTYAWVGFLSVSSFERFDINLEAQQLQEYGIEISLTGEDGTFGSSVDTIELKRVILKNIGYNNVDSMENNAVENAFNNLNLDQCSVRPNEDKTFPAFVNLEGKNTTKYFKFDLYLSAIHFYSEDSGIDPSTYLLNAYLKDNLLEGTVDTRNLINDFTYPSDFINPALVNGIPAGTKINGRVSVDSASAVRVAIQKYNVVEKFKPEQYEEEEKVNDLIIYQGGTQYPTYDSVKNVYSFGGIMEDDENLALYDYNTKFNESKKVPDWALNRGDKEYHENDQLISSTNELEKIGVNQMIKMTIYFWFEGWDSDCFDIIDRNPVTLNLVFGTSE